MSSAQPGDKSLGGERVTRAIVSCTEADDLILYIAYGPIAIPFSSVRRIALMPVEPE